MKRQRDLDDEIVRMDIALLERTRAESAARGLTGKLWSEHPVPLSDHECRTAQLGYVVMDVLYERCACGAIRRNGDEWTERNTRS